MEISTKASTRTANSMERVNISGQMDLATKVSSTKESDMDKEVGNQPK